MNRCFNGRLLQNSLLFFPKRLTHEASSLLEKANKKWELTVNKSDDEDAYTIKLNNISLKTPMKNLLKVKDRTLAFAIANEWKSKVGQKKVDLKTMHLTTLTYEAIDNPFQESDELVVGSIIEYLKFDTVRFRDVENEELLKKQTRHWDPLIGWFEHKYDCHVPIEYGDIMATNDVPSSTEQSLKRLLGTHRRWPLLGIRSMTKNLKSFVLATSLMERFLKVEQAVELSRLETRHQVEKWSKVEWEHDIDEQSSNACVAAGSLFYHLNL